MSTKSTYLAVFIVTLLFASLSGYASEGPSFADIQKKLTIDSLKKRPGIAIVIQANKHFRENVMNEVKLTAIVEEKLKARGVNVITDVKTFTRKDIFLKVLPTSIAEAEKESVSAISIAIQVEQFVTVDRTKTAGLLAPTWSTHSISIAGKEHLTDIKSFIEDDLDEFIDLYWKANPKK